MYIYLVRDLPTTFVPLNPDDLITFHLQIKNYGNPSSLAEGHWCVILSFEMQLALRRPGPYTYVVHFDGFIRGHRVRLIRSHKAVRTLQCEYAHDADLLPV